MLLCWEIKIELLLMLGWWRCLVMLHVHFVSVFVRSKKTTSIYISWSKWCVFRGKGCTWLGTSTKAYGTSWCGISQGFQHHKLSSVSFQYCLSFPTQSWVSDCILESTNHISTSTQKCNFHVVILLHNTHVYNDLSYFDCCIFCISFFGILHGCLKKCWPRFAFS